MPQSGQNAPMPPRAAKTSLFCRFTRAFAVIVTGGFSATAGPDYFTRAWQMEQGLPQDKVTAAVQTCDGCL